MALNEQARCRLDQIGRDFQANPYDLLDVQPEDVHRWRATHVTTIQKRRACPYPSDAAQNQEFLRSLQKTLRAWKVARAGSCSFQVFERQIRQAAETLNPLNGLRIECLTDDELNCVTNRLWRCIANLRITRKDAKLVSGTKAIHHLIPDLLPPMDRTYTGYAFGKNNIRGTNSYHFLEDQEEGTFHDIFLGFVRLVRNLSPRLIALEEEFRGDAESFNTSIPKTLDNLLIRFLERERNARLVQGGRRGA